MKTEIITSDVLIIGGGTSGCYAALTIAEQNPELKVVIAEKANIIRSGCLAAGVNALNAYITEGRKPEDYVDYATKDANGIVRKDLLLSMSQGLNRVTAKLEELGLVILKDENGKLMEPMERVIVNCPEVYSGTVINKLNLRKAMMEAMEIEGDYVKITFIAPTRGLLGYRSEFINDTRGEGSLVRSFERYEEHKGEMPGRTNGVLISQVAGSTMAYALNALSERAQMFVDPAVDVYEGMIIGMNSRKDDMVVNPTKNKKLTNVRASGSDDAIKLNAARTFTLEEALEFIDDDELVEITPDAIRLRKKFLNEHERLQYNKRRKAAQQ